MGHINRYSSFAAVVVMARSDKGHCMWVSTRPLTVGTETLPRILMPVVLVSEILIGYICIGFFASFLPHLCTGLCAVTFQLVTVIWLPQLLVEDLFWLKTQVHSVLGVGRILAVPLLHGCSFEQVRRTWAFTCFAEAGACKSGGFPATLWASLTFGTGMERTEIWIRLWSLCVRVVRQWGGDDLAIFFSGLFCYTLSAFLKESG